MCMHACICDYMRATFPVDDVWYTVGGDPVGCSLHLISPALRHQEKLTTYFKDGRKWCLVHRGVCMLCSEGFFHVNFRVWDVIVMQNVGAQRNDSCSFSMIIYPVPHCWNGSWRLSGPYHLHMPHHWQEKMCSQCSPANNNRYKA